MYNNVNLYDFERAFVQADRSDSFSYEAKKELFAFFEELEEDTDTQIELDVVAICCNWSEEPLQDVLDNYSIDSFEELQDNTTAIMTDNITVLYMAY